MSAPLSSYEIEFENGRNTLVIISDLMEEIYAVDTLIQQYQNAGATPAMYQQYTYRKQEFGDALNEQLAKMNLMIVSKAA